MSTARVLLRHWRAKGVAQLAARHPRRIRGVPAAAPFSAALCLAGVLLALIAVMAGGEGWLVIGAVPSAHTHLVPVFAVGLAVAVGFFLSQGTLPRVLDRSLAVVWLLPLALPLLLTGATGAYSGAGLFIAWGLYGLALALWVVARSTNNPTVRALGYASPIVAQALWAAFGGQQAADAVALTLILATASAIAVLPATLVARGVADLPRVHVWAGEAERWLSRRPEAILWIVGLKAALLLLYLAYGRWRFPELNWVPDSVRQWALSAAGALFVIAPMGMKRSRTLDLDRVGRIALALGVVVGSGLAAMVVLAIGTFFVRGGRWGSIVGITVLFALATAALTRVPSWRRRVGASLVLVSVAGLTGMLISRLGVVAVPVPNMSETAYIRGLLAGAIPALGIVLWITWRRGELWWAVRVVAVAACWILLLAVLRATGAGLAGVDIVLTALLAALVVWVRRHPGSRIAPIELLALCGLPVLLLYVPDLVVGAPETAQSWMLAIGLVWPAVAALWHHLVVDPNTEARQHTAGLAGLASLYMLAACAVLVLGHESVRVLPDAAELVLGYLAFPLSALLIAVLEQRRRRGQPPAVTAARP